MAPCVIADSDDDDDSSYSPPSKSPALDNRRNLDSTRSHDPVDRSGSTDSAFFRSVLDEQSAAARNCAHNSSRDGRAKPPSGSFGATTMMSTDPLQGHEGDTHQDPGELPGELLAAGGDDLWDVPSSREIRHSSAITRGKSGNRRKNTSFAQEEKSHRSSKRRKIEPSPDQTQDSDGIDLIQLPTTKPPDEDTDLQPMTTFPASSRGQRAYLIGNNLTNSQKEAYQSFAPTGTTEISQDQGPAQPEYATPIARSSSSATNVNTPRSDFKTSRNMGTILEHEQQTPEKDKTRTPIAQWDSSPDEISAPQPTSAATPVNKRKQGKSRRSQALPSEDGVMEHELDTRYEKADPVLHEVKDEESDYEETNVVAQKPKKQRGRPKKRADATSATDPANPPTSHAAEGRSVTKTKKKRGRPKKAEQQAVADVTEEVVEDTRVDADGQEVAQEESDTLPGREETTTDHLPAESDLQIQEEAATKKVETSKEKAAPIASDRESPEETDKAKEPDQGKIPKSVTTTPTPAISSSGSKPIYRVGLSKRSRIAPLLKIRK